MWRTPWRFDPVDETNERWEEIGANPDWAFASPPISSIYDHPGRTRPRDFQASSNNIYRRTVGCYAENLEWVGALLDRCPNFHIDISARIGELGRQPYSARKFFLRYSDRIFFGLDGGPSPEAYRLSCRFLETDDEYLITTLEIFHRKVVGIFTGCISLRTYCRKCIA